MCCCSLQRAWNTGGSWQMRLQQPVAKGWRGGVHRGRMRNTYVRRPGGCCLSLLLQSLMLNVVLHSRASLHLAVHRCRPGADQAFHRPFLVTYEKILFCAAVHGVAIDGKDVTESCQAAGCNSLGPGKWVCFAAEAKWTDPWHYLSVQLNRTSTDRKGDPDLYASRCCVVVMPACVATHWCC